MISREMVKTCYEFGQVQIVDSPLGDGAVCQIGEHWFYFGGLTAAEMSAAEYVKNIPSDTIIDEVYNVLKEFSETIDFTTEYRYYDAYLSGHIEDYNKELWNLLKKHIGHCVEIAYYGDRINPHDICLECTDCNEVVLDAKLYTVCVREDV